MFDKDAAQLSKNALPKLALERPCNMARLPNELSNYLEHYGFFDTLKAFDGDYYLGVQDIKLANFDLKIATHYWDVPETRGIVVLAHGLFDHVGLFQKLVSFCLQAGYSVFAIDLPGHGLSDGEPTVVDSFFDYAQVLTSAMAILPKSTVPFFGVGQSTGAAVIMAVAFDAVANNREVPFERMIFLGPLVRPRRWGVSRVIFKLLGGFIRSVGRDMSSANSHDEEFHSFLRYHDPLQSKRLSVRWVKALDNWVAYCADAPSVDTPLLIVQGTGDRVVDWKRNVPQLQTIFTCSQVNYIRGARHHLGNEAEPWRKTVYTSVTQFLKQRAICSV